MPVWRLLLSEVRYAHTAYDLHAVCERCRTDARMIRRETVQSEQFVANTG